MVFVVSSLPVNKHFFWWLIKDLFWKKEPEKKKKEEKALNSFLRMIFMKSPFHGKNTKEFFRETSICSFTKRQSESEKLLEFKGIVDFLSEKSKFPSYSSEKNFEINDSLRRNGKVRKLFFFFPISWHNKISTESDLCDLAGVCSFGWRTEKRKPFWYAFPILIAIERIHFHWSP